MTKFEKPEEVSILKNKSLADAIAESYAAKKKGVKTWKLKIRTVF